MRKGTVLIFLAEYENKELFVEWLKQKLNIKQCNFNYEIDINGYNVHIFKGYSQNYCRGTRSEICYINNSIDTNDETNDNNLNWFDVKTKTEMYSNRKEPVRIISSCRDIDINELLDDIYALENTIDKDKMKKWDDRNSIIDTTLKTNAESFKREYECKWIGDENCVMPYGIM